MGQLLGHALTLPEHHSDVAIEKWMVTAFVDAVRSCLKTGGYAEKKDEVEKGGIFLVGYRGRIFEIQSDYQVAERDEPYGAVGCGEDLALGAIFASQRCSIRPRRHSMLAIYAPLAFSPG